VSCKELVELVTDYLEGTLPPGERQRFDEHLQLCDGCVNYVEQMRATIVATGTLREESVPPEARDALLTAFRDWKRG
jgi:anti-sigma factor RsiW